MRDVEVGRVARALRRRRGWRQVDLAQRAGVHRSTISLVERGQLRGQTVEAIRRCLAPLGGAAELDVRWRGPELPRLLDERHATLQAAWASRMGSWGWVVDVEASFNRYGERGRVDLLAWDPVGRVVLVVEVKTELVDVQELLGALDVKARLGPSLARERGWTSARAIVRALIIREGTPARLRVATLGPLFDAFPLRGRAAVTWLAHRPAHEPAPTGLLIFSDLSPAAVARVKRVGRQRVRLARRRASVRNGSDRGAGED